VAALRTPIALLCLVTLVAGCATRGANDAERADVAATSATAVAGTDAPPASTTSTPADGTTSSDAAPTLPPTTDRPRPPTTFAVTARTAVAYGPETSQFGELWLPAAPSPRPVVVLVHGGFWRDSFGLDLMDDLAADLAGAGYAVWNIEYRRSGEPGGGWPGTFNDVAAAVDHVAALAADHSLDLEQLAIVGHSAGGHLALWAAGRATLADGAPGARPLLTPSVAIALAPVVDLVGAATDGVGLGAVDALLGGAPAEVPDRYAVATPALSDDVATVIVRGDADTAVPNPYSLPADPADRPAGLELVDVAGADHFDLIDADHAAWTAGVDRLPTG
jgi:acetyl esterase/lipase